MVTRIQTPTADQECAFCGSAIFDHDPICLRDCDEDCGSPTYFCNYACLSAHIDSEGLTTGDCCQWRPE